MPIYYVECDLGCGLLAAPDDDAAWEQHRVRVGTLNRPQRPRLATKQDIEYVRMMGGFVPKDDQP